MKQELTNQDTPISFDSGDGIDNILTRAFNGEIKSAKMSARVKPSAKQIIDSSNYSCADAIEYFACILNNEENSLQNTSGYGDGTNSYEGEFDFKNYLNSINVFYEIDSNGIETIFIFPIRINEIKRYVPVRTYTFNYTTKCKFFNRLLYKIIDLHII